MVSRWSLWLFPVLLVACDSAEADPGPAPTSLDFIDEAVGGDWDQAVGLTFAPDGRMFVWEKGGRVWNVEDGVKAAYPLIDISEEVGNWRDHGLLGFAVDPDFHDNGHIYLLYVVDYHHLRYSGTPSYDHGANHYFHDTIARLTRYTCNARGGHRSVDPDSRLVLVGETISTGFPVCHQSHGIGSLLFGEDGTLLASSGDGASYEETDTGGPQSGSSGTALADGIIKPKEDVGAYRAQLVDSLSGKIIRVDPATGNGVPSNPFHDAADPRSARSRVWSLGLRNPFRMALRPGTGNPDPGAADPGTLYIGDVGWMTWEELDVNARPGENFGWPAFEGMLPLDSYLDADVENLDAPNPLFGQSGCASPFFFFRDLIVQDTLEPTPFFPNPCNPAEQVSAQGRFVHRRPVIDWNHYSATARAAIYEGQTAAVIPVGAPGSPVAGAQFAGLSSTGGAWYTGTDFPEERRSSYYHADFGGRWIRQFVFDANDRPTAVHDFKDSAGAVTAIATDPARGGLYYIRYDQADRATVRRIRYGTGALPVAIAGADHPYGVTPLRVQFTGSGSTSTGSSALSYRWDFGDGTTSDLADPVHVYTGQEPAGGPARRDVTLTVTDAASNSSTARILVSLDNTPPSVQITSPVDGARYAPDGPGFLLPLSAEITDAEHGAGELTCHWRTILHHNEHTHPEADDPHCATVAAITPIGCDGETYFYEFILTVTDAHGLSTSATSRIHPDCPPEQ